VDKVANGSKLVEQAGKTMDEIVTSVKRVTDIMSEISAASQEQSQGIEQVNQTITQMDEVTQQNAALVEEASAASRSLEEQAAGLAASVAQFRIDQSVMASAPAPAAPAPAPRATVPYVRPVAKPAAERIVVRPALKAVAPNGAKPAHANGLARNGGEGQWTEF
jgi:methyl-accepting chemotaxis protein